MNFFYIFLFTLLFMGPGYAYMDLGSVSALIQIIFSGIFGAIVAIKLYFRRIKEFFIKKKKK